MEYNEEDKDLSEDMMDEDMDSGTTKQWFRDNLRIIISVLIVVIIAGGIYSYSKRSEAPTANPTQQTQNTGNEEGNLANPGQQNQQNAQTNQPTAGQTNQQPSQQPKTSVSSTATSQETDTSFIETAGRGDSLTVLARRSLSDYLEKNTDSSLTVEHKIYIEDYLRKNVGRTNGIRVGTSVEFQKSLIQNAINQAKTLNSRQLQNLHKYAVRVPSLS